MIIRLLDVLFAGIALIVLFPAFLVICALLRFTGEGEVFYLQKRLGAGKKQFYLVKFATMLKDSASMRTGTVTVADDPRILPLGKILRKTKVNELPQLLNILKGDMSLVGPRPLTEQTFSAYSAEVQGAISKVLPGLSGIGSIIFRDEEEMLLDGDGSLSFYQSTIAPYKGQLECWFSVNRDVKTYFKVILATIVVILVPRSKFPWIIFNSLPEPPLELRDVLNYPEMQN